MSVHKSLAWMLPAQVAAAAFQFASTVAAARFLSPSEMGIYATAISVVSILTISQLFGISSFLIREANLNKDSVTAAFSMNLVFCLSISSVMVVTSFVFTALLKQQALGYVLLVLSINPALSIMEFLPLSLLERNGQFGPVAAGSLIKTAVGFLSTLILLFNDKGIDGLAFSIVVSNFAGAIFFLIYGRRYVSFVISFNGGEKIFRFGVQQLAIQGVNTLASRFSDLILASVLGYGALGLYSRAASLNGLLWSNVQMIVGRVMLVNLAGHHREGLDIRIAYMRSVAVMTGFLWPAFAGVGILAGPLIRIIYGEAWVSASPVLSFLAIASIILTSLSLTWELFVIFDETSRQARLEFIRTGFGFTLFAIGCWFGLYLAAATRVAEAVISIFIYRPQIARMTHIPYREFTKIYLRSALLTGCSSWPAIVLLCANNTFVNLPASQTVLSILIGACCWSLCLVQMKHPLYEEVRSLYLKTIGSTN